MDIGYFYIHYVKDMQYSTSEQAFLCFDKSTEINAYLGVVMHVVCNVILL